MHNPWGILRRLSNWTLTFAPLPAGMLGHTSWRDRTVTIRPGLSQAERRSVMAHEEQHLRRGPGLFSRREEVRCDQGAARALIDLHDLGEALAWAHNLDEAADELWVDRRLLDVRLAHLHPSERAQLKRRLAEPDAVLEDSDET